MMKNTDYLFPRYQVTLGQVKACKGLTIKEAADKLGVKYVSFRPKIEGSDLLHLFHSRKSVDYFMPTHRVTFERALRCCDMTIKDAAEACNVSLAGFRSAAKKFEVTSWFERGKKPIYVEPKTPSRIVADRAIGIGPKLEKVSVECYERGCTELIWMEVWPGSSPNTYQHCPTHKRRFAA